MKQNTGVSNIEITKDNIKAFQSTAKKYGIDFALKKDATDLLLCLRKYGFHSLLQHFGGQLPGLDIQGNGFFVDLVENDGSIGI